MLNVEGNFFFTSKIETSDLILFSIESDTFNILRIVKDVSFDIFDLDIYYNVLFISNTQESIMAFNLNIAIINNDII